MAQDPITTNELIIKVSSLDDNALVNTATAENSISVAGTPTPNGNATQIGFLGYSAGYGATAYGWAAQAQKSYATAIGPDAAVAKNTGENGSRGIALGYHARVSADDAIQIGYGTNSTANTLSIGLGTSNNYTLLDSSGNIPAARIASLPASDGTYIPVLTISSGVPTIAWVAYSP